MGPEGAVIILAGAVVLSVMGLTAWGERRRGHGGVVALVAGAFFPVTWVAWYLRDGHADRTARRA